MDQAVGEPQLQSTSVEVTPAQASALPNQETTTGHAESAPASTQAAEGQPAALGQELQASGTLGDAASSVPTPSSAKIAPAEINAAEGQAERAAAVDAAANQVPEETQEDIFQREFKQAQSRPEDFNQWTSLIAKTEKLGEISKLRQVYDFFLAEFPLCYGYWKKYADAEHKNASMEWAMSVYDRGTAAIPYSVDLWGSYCIYSQSAGCSVEDVRGLFERGLAYVGSDYLSHSLWDKYLTFELTQGNFIHVAQIYSRLLHTPLKELDRYLNSLKDFAGQHTIGELLTEVERSSLVEALKSSSEAVPADPLLASEAAASGVLADPTAKAMEEQQGKAAAGPEAGGAQPAAEGIEAGSALPNGHGAAADVPDVIMADGAELTVSDDDIKSRWLAGLEAVYQATKTELAKRQEFEGSIKRPYFHVKPLDAAQLATWWAYLDYIQKSGDAGTIVRLYERCLVACASYPEFWIRYARYLEGQDPESGNSAMQRAQHVHCKRNAHIHLFAARREERLGDPAAARATYQRVLKELAPGLITAVVQYANFERRQGSTQAARSAYEDFLAADGAKEGGPSAAGQFLTVQYAHFLHTVLADTSAARGVLMAALDKAPGSKLLWEGAIHFEQSVPGEERAARTLALYERASAPPSEGQESKCLSAADMSELSARSVEFADLAADVETLAKVEARHARQFPEHARSNRKRAGEEPGAAPPAKQAKVEEAGISQAPVAPWQTAAPQAYPAASAVPASYYPQASAAAYSYYGSYAAPQQYPAYTYPAY